MEKLLVPKNEIITKSLVEIIEATTNAVITGVLITGHSISINLLNPLRPKL
ncbi:hypothetical protein OAU47_02530 [Pelagibacterales bacterium]|nr:hypothetical protein [Pelagibacterales bacterium]